MKEKGTKTNLFQVLLKKSLCCFLCIALLVIAIPFSGTEAQAAAIKLNRTSASLAVKEKTVLKLSGTTKTPAWSSSNTKVATVSKGTVTAKAEGSATITAKLGSKKYTCKITVKGNYKKLYKSLLSKSAKTLNWYYVLDLDKNGVPDLIAGKLSGNIISYVVYTVRGGKAVKAGECAMRGMGTKPTLTVGTRYRGIITSGWTNFVGGTWSNLFMLSNGKLQHKRHIYSESYPKTVYYTGTTDTNRKKVSKASYNKFYKTYFSASKKYNMISNTSANRTKSFG